MPRVAPPPPLITAPRLNTSWGMETGDHVIRLAWSPDGMLLASATVAGPIRIWEGSTGEPMLTWNGHGFGTQCLAWSRSGKLIATGGQDGRIRIHSLQEGRMIAEMDGGAPWVEQIAWCPERDVLVSGAGRKLRLWNADGSLIHEYPDFDSTIYEIQWQPESRHFAVAGYGGIAMFQDDSPKLNKKFDWKGSILCIAYSPDGNSIATGNQDASVHFWYRRTGKDLQMTGYMTKVRELSWDYTSRYLATGGSPVVIVWDCGGKGPAGSTPSQLEGHGRAVSALAFQNKGGFLSSGCSNGLVCVWNHRKTDRPIRQYRMESGVTQVCWARDDRSFAVGTEGGQVRVFVPSADAK